jgi:hypothetical protein
MKRWQQYYYTGLTMMNNSGVIDYGLLRPFRAWYLLTVITSGRQPGFFCYAPSALEYNAQMAQRSRA